MNRIYKIIWSKVRHCYVVVSEIAKNNGKNKAKSVVGLGAAARIKKLAAAALATGLLLPIGMPAAWADETPVTVPTHMTGTGGWQAISQGQGVTSYHGGTAGYMYNLYQVIGIDSSGNWIISSMKDPNNRTTFLGRKLADFGTPGNTTGQTGDSVIYAGDERHPLVGIAIGNYADIISSPIQTNAGSYYGATGIAIGDYTRAKGTYSVALGPAAAALGTGSVSLGAAAGSTGIGAVAIGRQTAATNTASVAVGVTASAQGAGAVAIGRSSHAKGDQSIAIGTTGGGTSTNNSGGYSTAVTNYDGEDNTESLGKRSIAMGTKARTTSDSEDSFAIGNYSSVDGAKSIAMGVDTAITGDRNVTQGNGVKVTGSDNIIQGNNANITGKQNIVQGSGNTISDSASTSGSTSSIIQGNNNTITGSINHVRGSSNTVVGNSNTVDSHGGIVYGSQNIAIGDEVTIGSDSRSIDAATAVGYKSKITADGGVALGNNSIASVAKDVAGYDPTTGAASTSSSAAWKSTRGAVSVSSGSNDSRQIVGVAAGTNDTDAVNVAQLKSVDLKHTEVTVEGGKTANTSSYTGDKLQVKKSVGTNGQDIYDLQLSDKVATKDDGLKFKGDDATVINKKLNEQLDIVGGATGTLTDGNIGVNSTSDGKLKIQLNKDVNLTDDGSVTIGEMKLAKQAGGGANTGTGHYLTGLDNKDWDSTNIASGRAATEDQLKAVADSDKFVTGGTVTYADNGTGTGSLTVANGTAASVTGLHDYYVTSATVSDDGKTLTMTRNDAQTFTVNLQNVLNQDYRLVKNPNTTDGKYTVSDDGTIDLTVSNKAGSSETVTLSGIATKNDGLKFAGDDNQVISKKLGETLEIIVLVVKTCVTLLNLRNTLLQPGLGF